MRREWSAKNNPIADTHPPTAPARAGLRGALEPYTYYLSGSWRGLAWHPWLPEGLRWQGSAPEAWEALTLRNPWTPRQASLSSDFIFLPRVLFLPEFQFWSLDFPGPWEERVCSLVLAVGVAAPQLLSVEVESGGRAEPAHSLGCDNGKGQSRYCPQTRELEPQSREGVQLVNCRDACQPHCQGRYSQSRVSGGSRGQCPL